MKLPVKFLITFLFLAILFLPLAALSASAETVSSNCVILNVGSGNSTQALPPECQNTTTAGPIALKAVELARAQIGKPYVFGAPFGRPWASLDPAAGRTPSSFDCSGLTGWAWYWASGGKISMNGQTWWDWSDSAGNGSTRYIKHPPTEKPQPGDLLYWRAPGGNQDIVHHTAIYSGACKNSSGSDCFIEAECTVCGIHESHLNNRLGGSDPLLGFMRPVLQ